MDHHFSLLDQINSTFVALVRMVEIGLQGQAGQAGWVGQNIRYNGRMEVLVVVGSGSGATTLDLELFQVSGSGVCHHFRWICRGRGLFVLVQKNNSYMLHTNPNIKIVKDSKYIPHEILALKNTT